MRKKYQCDQCEPLAGTLNQFKRHKESKHEGIRYPCDQCKYLAGDISTLKHHKDLKHKGIRYPCDQCEYWGAGSLRRARTPGTR